MNNEECQLAAEEFVRIHGDKAWQRLCKAWHMDDMDLRAEKAFKAGLAMGFCESLKIVRDASREST